MIPFSDCYHYIATNFPLFNVPSTTLDNVRVASCLIEKTLNIWVSFYDPNITFGHAKLRSVSRLMVAPENSKDNFLKLKINVKSTIIIIICFPIQHPYFKAL